MSIAAAFARVGAYHRAQVEVEMSGHLAPVPRRIYRGSILFVSGEYGDVVPVKVRFEGLPDSPWFYDDLQEFIEKFATRSGKVYRFVGIYRKAPNGKARFVGRTHVVRIPMTHERRRGSAFVQREPDQPGDALAEPGQHV
jgi:hypothetical protein